MQFAQMFQNTIGSSALSDVEKLSRLLGLLDGEPKKLLAGLLVTDANYRVARNTLERRYGDSERTARELKIELDSLPSPRATTEVWDFQVRVESLVQQLDSLGHPPASEATIWTLENKLPRRCLEKLWEERKNVEARAGPGNVWNLAEFRTALEGIVIMEERIGGVMAPSHSGASQPVGPSRGRAKPARRIANTVITRPSGKPVNKVLDIGKNQPKDVTEGMNGAKKLAKAGAKSPKANPGSGCLFCGGSHQVYLCPLSVKERRVKVGEAKCCFKCLRPGHWANNCSAEPC